MSWRRIPVAGGIAIVAVAVGATAWLMAWTNDAGTALRARSCWSSPDCDERCAAGDARACTQLGRRYLRRSRLVPNPSRSAVLLEQAYSARDDDDALAAYSSGCEAGDVNACARAVMDREACELGSPISCSRVARPYLYGVGEKVDLAEGIAWEKRACAVGYAPSCVYVAHAALRGEGAEADMAAAVAYAERAIELYGAECDLGDPSACDYVGDTYDEKPLGRSRSGFEARTKGTALYEESCAGGNAIHCQVAAFRYGNGLGAVIDPARSDALLGQACRLGQQGACEALEPEPPPSDDQSFADEAGP